MLLVRRLTIVRQILLLSPVIIIATSCSNTSKELWHYDGRIGLSRQEFTDKMEKSIPEPKESDNNAEDGNIPDLKDIITAPKKAAMKKEKLISISVTEDIAIKDVLLEIGRVSGVDIQIAPDIEGHINFIAKRKTITEVLDRICELTNIKYQYHGKFISIEVDKPYVVSYRVNFLNITRSGTSSNNLTTTITGSASGSSQFNMNTKGEDTFWDDMQKNIGMILTEHSYKTSDKTNITDNLTETNINLNKQAGILMLMATDKAHRKVTKYLDMLRKQITAQVLIEVKFVEVSLNEAFSTGIDWGNISLPGAFKMTMPFGGAASAAKAASVMTLTGGMKDLSAVISLFNEFGTTRTLSNPRLNALNNQPASLSIVDNEVYFKVSITTQQVAGVSGSGGLSSGISAVAVTTPVGIVLTLQPSIDLQTREILMTLRPSITKKTGSVDDPSIDLVRLTVKDNTDPSRQLANNQVPVISTREVDSVVKIKDGDVLIMGGFTSRDSKIVETGVPFLSQIPILGLLFRKKTSEIQNVETVIFIKATIVDDQEIGLYDKEFYKSFISDPRPAKL